MFTKINYKNESVFMFISGLFYLALSPDAVAQVAEDEPRSNALVLEEIVVTAQKRIQTLQDVPVAVSVFDSNFLERSQVTTAKDLVSFAPGVGGTTVSSTTPRINVRGVSTEDFGIGSDPALGFYVDGVYLGRGVSSVNDIFDVDRVEIVKGPQGTLFGRNTTAGAISILSKRPIQGEPETYVSGSLGNYGATAIRAASSFDVSKTSAMRVAISHREHDGYIDNSLGGELKGEQTSAARVSLSHTNDSLSVFGSAELRSTENGAQGYINSVLVGTDIYGDVSSDLGSNGKDNIDSYRALLEVEKSLDGMTLTSITSIAGFSDQEYLEDTDASPLKLIHFGTQGDEDTVAQEFRLSGDTERFNWFVGVSGAWTDTSSTQFALFNEEDWCAILVAASCLDAFGLAGNNNVQESSVASGDYSNYSIYGDAIIKVTDRLSATIGARYSYTEKEFNLRFPLNNNLLGPVTLVPPSRAELEALGTVGQSGELVRTSDWSGFQPRLAFDYSVNDDTKLYISASNGFKSGGFNQLNIGPAFDEETLWSYELGLKGTTLNKRVRYDIAAYYYEYDDLQTLVQIEGLPAPITQNAASSQGKGLEAQIDFAASDGLTLSAGLALQDAEYEQFSPNAMVDFSGNKLVRTPDTSLSIIADYRRPVRNSTFFTRLEYSYRDQVFFTPDNSNTASQESYDLINLSAGFTLFQDRLTLTAFVKNLGDEEYLVDVSRVVPGLIEYTQRGEPRFYGAEIRYDF